MTTSVVVCAYTLDRWADLQRAIASLEDQTVAPDEVVVVIDYNDDLLVRARESFTHATVVANRNERGLSGARNTGVLVSRGDVLLFLDDDAYADPKWIGANLRALDDVDVVGVGSWIEPLWEGGAPNFFPDSFLWVMGCSYAGLPSAGETIRNPIGAGMALRREVFTQVGGFSSGLGRVGSTPLGCEETELAIRYSQHRPEARIVHAPEAIVHHYVPRSRLSWSYFLHRCWAEGLSKAAVSALVGTKDGLSAERRHVMTALPRDLLRSLSTVPRSPRSSTERAVRIALGACVAAAGMLWGTWALKRHPDDVQLSRETASWKPLPMIRVDLEVDSAPSLVVEGEVDRAWVELWRGQHFIGRRIVPVHEGALQWRSEYSQAALDASPTDRERVVAEDELPHITVVICTIYEEPVLFSQVIEKITSLDYPHFDVVVVDNRRGEQSQSIELAPNPHGVDVIKVEEPTPGLSAARNRGLLTAGGEIVAFTDDDVLVDDRWLRAMGERFARSPQVSGVGGLILPAELRHQSQLWFEEYFGGFSRDYSLRIVGPDEGRHDSLYPYTPGRFGAGANMAFRREALLRHGGFSMSLGAGTPSRGGEDLDIFLRLALSKEVLCFDPALIVRHRHRTTVEDLRRQIEGYGAGLTAMFAELVSRNPVHLLHMARRALRGVSRVMASRRENSPSETPSFPRDFQRLERRGALRGPWWNFRARRQVRIAHYELSRVLGRPR